MGVGFGVPREVDGMQQCFIDSVPELKVVITTYFFFAVLLVLFFVLLFVVTVSRPGGITKLDIKTTVHVLLLLDPNAGHAGTSGNEAEVAAGGSRVQAYILGTSLC